MLSRRDALGTLGSALGAAALIHSRPALAQEVAAADLMVAGPLGDVWQGPQTAKVAIIEYASLTCSHCAQFHKVTYPELKKRYIESGQARFTLREFPLDPLATAGFMLARADNGARYYPITDLLFETQASWAFVPKPLDALAQTMRQAGFSQEKFETTLRDQKLYDAVNAVKNRGTEKFKVDSTPTFFVNGQRIKGAASLDELEKIIKPILGV